MTRNAFYWTRVATTVAQASGMHRRFVMVVTLASAWLEKATANSSIVSNRRFLAERTNVSGEEFGGHSSLETVL